MSTPSREVMIKAAADPKNTAQTGRSWAESKSTESCVLSPSSARKMREKVLKKVCQKAQKYLLSEKPFYHFVIRLVAIIFLYIITCSTSSS